MPKRLLFVPEIAIIFIVLIIASPLKLPSLFNLCYFWNAFIKVYNGVNCDFVYSSPFCVRKIALLCNQRKEMGPLRHYRINTFQQYRRRNLHLPNDCYDLRNEQLYAYLRKSMQSNKNKNSTIT